MGLCRGLCQPNSRLGDNGEVTVSPPPRLPLPAGLSQVPEAVFAVAAADAAGEFLMRRPDVLRTETKSSAADVVTHMDKASEQMLVAAIVGAYPEDGIVGEEGAAHDSSSGRRWVIDPIDGTTNYVYDQPFWCVSIALEDERGGYVGVVGAPRLGRMYAAVRGQGAWRREVTGEWLKLSVSGADALETSLIGTGFGYTASRRAGQARVLQVVLPQVRDIRRLGSCALDLCLVADGELDAYYERGVHLWDFAAGAVVALEAGARVSGLRGQACGEAMAVAGTPEVHAALVRILENSDADDDRS